MNTFINEYKNSIYYPRLFEVDSDIIIAYLGGSYSFKTNHDKSDYDINVITLDSDFFSVYFDWHLKYKSKTVHWYYRPVSDFFRLTCYDLIDYVGVLTLLHIPKENIIYLNPKYEHQWNYLYDHRDQLLKHICIELGLSVKSFINFVLESDLLKARQAQRVYFICLAAYYHLNIAPDYVLLKKVSKAKHTESTITQTEFDTIKKLLQKFLDSLADFNLDSNRALLKSLEKDFKFI